MDELLALIERINILSDEVGNAWEMVGDLVAQHHSEVAMFGDSWPGAQLEVWNAESSLRSSEQELADMFSDLDSTFPVFGPPAVYIEIYEPF